MNLLFRVNDGAKVDDIHCEQVLIPTTFGPLSTSMPRPTKPTPTENLNKEGSQNLVPIRLEINLNENHGKKSSVNFSIWIFLSLGCAGTGINNQTYKLCVKYFFIIS